MGRIELNQLSCGLEWQERLEGLEDEREGEPGLVSVDGYLYRLAPGDGTVQRFSVMIGVWGQADPVQSV